MTGVARRAWVLAFVQNSLLPRCTSLNAQKMGQVGCSSAPVCEGWCPLKPGFGPAAAGPALPIPAPCQLENWALGALLSLLWGWLPVSLRLLHLV